MYGAILGDMIGAPYEFDRGRKTKDFPLFSRGSEFTDDTVMTIAVAEALLDTMGQPEKAVKEALVRSMQKWGHKYPNAGYGYRFGGWLRAKNPEPYNSFGNGSAMRVSPAGWLFETLEQTRTVARWTSEVTHNHPEGIKGAEATASAIWLARNGKAKDEIKGYIIREFGYDLSRTCDEIRPGYHHVESCQETVPEAITAFLEGTDFEDVIRTAVSLGGDCDTLTCIAGSMAEAFYGVPALLEAECTARLPAEMLEVLARFDAARGRTIPETDNGLGNNTDLEKAIERLHNEDTDDALIGVLEEILRAMHRDAGVLVPVYRKEPSKPLIDPEQVQVGDVVTVDEPIRFGMHHLETNDGRQWLVGFTSREESEKVEETSTIGMQYRQLLEEFANLPEAGIILNPWGKPFLLTKELMERVLKMDPTNP